MRVIKFLAHQKINLVIAFLLLYLVAITFGSVEKTTLSKRGFADLGPHSRDKSGVELSGEWEFYWGALIAPGDFASSPGLKPDAYLALPSTWNTLRLAGRRLPNLGYATLRLSIRHGWKGKEVGIKVKRINTAFTLYADDRIIARAGSVSADATTSHAQYRPQSVYFVPESDTTALTLQISNMSVPALDGGPSDEIVIGTREAVENETNRLLISDALNFGGRLLFVLFFLGAFILRKEGYTLFFSLYNFILLLRLSQIREVLFVRIFPFVALDSFARILLLSSFLSGPLFFLTIWTFLRKREAQHSGLPRRNWSLASLMDSPIDTMLVLAIVFLAIAEILFFAFADSQAYLPSYRIFLPVFLVSIFYPFFLILGHTRKYHEFPGMLGLYALSLFFSVIELLSKLRIIYLNYLFPFFFLRAIPALSWLSRLRVQQQFPSYLCIICFSFYFFQGFLTVHANRPQAGSSAPAQPPALPSMQKTEKILREYNITDREKGIIVMAINGLSYEEIAAKSFISKNTVKFHLRNIYRKLDVKNKIELMNKIR